jgi:hypothetical protein
MYSLFRLLFKSAYWRTILRKATYVEAGRSLLRAHKDKRARTHLLRLGLLLITPALCIGYLAWIWGLGAWFILPIVIPIAWWFNRDAKQAGETLHIAPTPPPLRRTLTEEESKALRASFAAMTLLIATMVDRAGSEKYLKEKELPPGIEPTTRRTHLEVLKKYELWEKMDRADREAMMMPDGHWEWPLINRVTMAMEPLRLLRWILRIDFHLPLIGQQLRGDFNLAHELVLAPEKLFEGKNLATEEMMETGRDAADHFFQRCLAETIHRGYYNPNDEGMTERARRIAQSLAGQQDKDFVLGTKLVSEASKDEVLWATNLSQRRRDFLHWIIRRMRAAKPPDPPMVRIAGE